MKPFLAIGAILVSAGLITATPAEAQTQDQKAGARAAAEAGGDAFDSGRYAEAADLFERAERLLHAPPHLLFAARSHVKLGHLVEARELYLTLTREHLAPNAPRAFKDAQQLGEKELAAVEPRLAYASVVVQGGAGASNVKVTRNGEPVPAELLGVPTPVNPGESSYQAFADDMESTTTKVNFREGVRETVVLTLRAVPGAKKKAAPATDAGEPGAQPGASTRLTEPPATDARSSGGRPFLVGSLVGFGVAVAGSVVGTVFLLQGLDRQNEADTKYSDLCRVDCTHEKIDPIVDPIDADAKNKKTVAVVGYVAGGVGLITGFTLLILDQNRATSTLAKSSLTPIVGLNYAGLAGTF